MGGSHSREGLELSESESESESETELFEEAEDEEQRHESETKTSTSLDSIDSKLKSLNLKYSNSPSSSSSSPSRNPNPNPNPNAVKLYLHVGGSSPSAKWILSEKLTSYSFVRSDSRWLLTVGSKIRSPIGPELQLKPFPDQLRFDFVADGVWAIKFFSKDSFLKFLSQFNDCLFENTYGFEANEENRGKVFGKDFGAWVNPETADDSVWEDADVSFEKPPRDLLEEFEEAASEGSKIQSLALGALDNSFLVGDSSVQVVRNFSDGVHGKGLSVRLSKGSGSRGNFEVFSTPKKALLMKAETNMMLMTPESRERSEHATGVHQLDIETGKIVTEWKFNKDGTDITMRDITNDSKGSQLDASEATFLGLDDNRLCRWDMRDKRGIVQDLASSSPVLEWSQGHQFARGTQFQCFASTGDGSIVVGSLDGKIRLYSKSSMRMAKTAFPGLGSPITHVDVTYDGKWILGTTDTYLILISTVFKDIDGKEKTGFSGRMGNRIAAPRLLKLTPLDAHLAGKDNKFHGGQFSWVTENGKQERHLVATVGKFSIIWNFQQVKNSKHECYRNQEGLKSCYCYKIVLRDESIVDSRFMHDKYALSDSPEAPLVVATPMKVSSFSISSRH